jgi:hypothetical protein
MIETLASAYFELFPGDWLFGGIISTVIYYFKFKKDDDFYG